MCRAVVAASCFGQLSETEPLSSTLLAVEQTFSVIHLSWTPAPRVSLSVTARTTGVLMTAGAVFVVWLPPTYTSTQETRTAN